MIEHQQIFPTNIFLIDQFIPQSVKSEKQVIENMKKYISDLWTERDYDNNWQTKSADLHTKKEFHHFSTLVRKTGMDICNKLGYDVEDLIITDNDNPIALAGVMGGYDTEVTDTTTNLLIESAYFDKVSIMKTSRRLNLISDASIRFERGIDFNLQKQGLQRFVNLFENDQEINYSSIIDSSKNGISYDSISFDKNEIEQILGVELDDNFIRNTFCFISSIT